jgi:hypothetical protein
MEDNKKDKEEYKPLTLEKLEEYVQDIFNNPKWTNEREIVIYQGCITKGAVERSSINLNICDNPNCPSCKMLSDALAEEAKNFIDIPLDDSIDKFDGTELRRIYDDETGLDYVKDAGKLWEQVMPKRIEGYELPEDSYTFGERLTPKEVMKKYGEYLSDRELEKLKDLDDEDS